VIYEVTEGKEVIRVELREAGENLYDVTIGEHSVRVDVAKSGRTVYSVIEDGQQFEAMVEERGGPKFDVLVRGRLFHLEAVDERSRLLSQAAATLATGPETVSADMPGKIVKLEVARGDAVRAGQPVVIVEAMKMENPIPAPIDGVVTDISVREGDTVESGAPLFTVTPPPAPEAA
jgi:biotin carboxyl carrier protein